MKSRKGIALLIGALILAIGGASYAAISVILAVGTINHSELFDGPATLTVRQMTILPGEVLPWHYHPGVAFTAVKRGTLTLEDGCGKVEVLTAGQAFEELHSHIHRAANQTSSDVEVFNTFVVPQGQPTTTPTPNNERLCGPPQNAGQCRLGGWTNFTFPRIFQNQGDCEQFAITGK